MVEWSQSLRDIKVFSYLLSGVAGKCGGGDNAGDKKSPAVERLYGIRHGVDCGYSPRFADGAKHWYRELMASAAVGDSIVGTDVHAVEADDTTRSVDRVAEYVDALAFADISTFAAVATEVCVDIRVV